jgi:O-antigen/teichoic acid export membrane protein
MITAAAESDASPSLAQKILGETARFAALQVVAASLAWIANIVLARILERRDFGVYGICIFYIGIGTLLGDGGLGAALLRRRREPTKKEFRIALTALLGVSAVLGGAMFIAAPYIGHYNRFAPSEVNVLRAMAPLYFVNAFRVVPYIRLERALQFSRIARIELTASLVRHLVAISLALAGAGVWSLVVAGLTSSALQLVFAYRASPGWVGIGWSWRVFRPLIGYGGKVQALGICSYLKDNISAALLGSALGPAAVGLFDFGLKYIQIPVTAVNSLARVQLPVYARLDAHDPTLFAALRGATRTALLLGIPLLGALAFAGPWVIPLVYSPRWAPAYPVIWGLLANMIGGLVASPLFTLLQGQGRPGLAIVVFVVWTMLTWALAIVGLVLVPGSLGLVALAHSIVTVGIVIALIAWAGRHLGRGLFASLRGPVISGAIAFGMAALLPRSTAFLGVWCAHPIARTLVAIAAYFACLVALERRMVVDEFRALVASVRGKRGKSPADERGRDDASIPRAA